MAWQAGSTRRWRRVREYVLLRDGQRCRAHTDGWCARAPNSNPHTCTGRAGLDGGHAHHTLGRSVTGDDPRYLVAACAPCNLHIGDPAEHARAGTPDPRPTPRTNWRSR